MLQKKEPDLTDNNELPASKADRVDWVIRAPDNAEMRRRYDIWATHYDADVGSVEDYLAPLEAVAVVRKHCDPAALILDAGAGTGLVGEALEQAGFDRLEAVDFAPQMLDIARGKGLYQDIHVADLSRQTALQGDRYDAIVTCGTTTQMPSAALREYVRLVRPGGKIVFAVMTGGWQSFGWADVFEELEAAGVLSLIEKNPPFQMMPTTEPEFYCEIWVMQAV